ncbi:PQQ-dependent sugar dehydrogenase [Roseateles amylovorans]|uniref:PQQ-dependent sugar dehydrogenase n=1 Tax=Roseateles amylovorans TaxID=2978473 RepID=A0ABY6AYC2_9BURK|nr:PQQ-dependent sugar dehydrogenase [Roseateles amylovorans]UXH77902.1 PQQ-dependent sugar dehydrogenase [Roseateles amylovorans]
MGVSKGKTACGWGVTRWAACVVAIGMSAGGAGAADGTATPTATAAAAAAAMQSGTARPVDRMAQTDTVAENAPPLQTLSTSLDRPWGMAQLPSGDLLITQKGGTLVRVSTAGKLLATVSGVPKVLDVGQGGLLGIAIDPDFAAGENWVYLSYSEPGTGAEARLAGTSVARGRLKGDQLVDLQVIFRQQPKVDSVGHYGSRIVFARDKTVFITTGERMKGQPSQDLAQTLGKVIHLNRDGSLPSNNPSLGATARPGIWSYGHRNIQGAALHPQTGELWVSEHGPQGGDEINIARAGQNYGWPVRSYGCPYGSPVGEACRLGGGKQAPEFVEPLTTWVPLSIAPAGLVFYTGTMFPQWRGQLFSGSLAGQALWRLTLDGDRVVAREKMYGSLGERFRDVVQAQDGALLMVTDGGKLLRLAK